MISWVLLLVSTEWAEQEYISITGIVQVTTTTACANYCAYTASEVVSHLRFAFWLCHQMLRSVQDGDPSFLNGRISGWAAA
jgi:hypothetical protein